MVWPRAKKVSFYLETDSDVVECDMPWFSLLERDMNDIHGDIEGDKAINDNVSRYGLLKFMEYHLMHYTKLLLKKLIELQDHDAEVFMV